MKQTKVKANKDGSLTVYVSAGQSNLFMWILNEGEAGLRAVEDEGESVKKGYKLPGIETRQPWMGFQFVN